MAKEKDNKVKKENKHFMKDVKAELKRVTWPTSKQMVNNVTAVIAIVVITAIIVFVLDFVFGGMNKYGIEKLKEHVKPNEQTQVIDDTKNNEQQDNASENNGNENDINTGDVNSNNTENIEGTENVENTDVNQNSENINNN